ncbi:hypothetical protein CPB86DRAFT_728711 [Serendipita vermifera]|nr:hypothetical protein CPB86DRAFT_728711 [Serendipita vermifera]
MSLLWTGNLTLKKAKSSSVLARLVINLHYTQTRLHIGSRRGFHLTSNLNKSTRRGSEESPGPRYVQGPTLPGLRLVVQALKDGPPQMQTKDIWKSIHSRPLEEAYALPDPRQPNIVMLKNGEAKPVSPEPSYPNHPVRSIKYLKDVLLYTLKEAGRVRKVHVTRELTSGEMEEIQQQKMSGKKKKNGPQITDDWIHNWVWELVSPESGIIPIEQQKSIPTQKADLIWMRYLDLTETQREAYGVDNILPQIKAQEHEITAQDSAYGSVLAVKWQDRTSKDRTSALRSNEQVRGLGPRSKSAKVDWKDPGEKERKEMRRKERGHDWAPTSSTSSSQTREIGLPLLNSSKKVAGATKPKPYLNPDEPEYRQSRKGANDIPLALQDPRRRQYGFHYGLPKQKELLRAANTREYDQEEWLDPPPHDISHLSPRRQRARLASVSTDRQRAREEDRLETQLGMSIRLHS